MALTSKHIPAAKAAMMGALMTGHADNHNVATLIPGLGPAARAMVMRSVPASASYIVVGTVLHFAFSAFISGLVVAVVIAAAWTGTPGLRNPAGMIPASIVGGAIVHVINRWALLPPTNPMMRFVPQIAFFLTHLLVGLVVGISLAMAFRRRHVAELLPTGR